MDRQHIGFSTVPTTVRVDAWRVKLFCQAIGEQNPLFWSDEAARAQGHRAAVVPPTFLKAMESEHCGSAQLLQQMGVPVRRVLHAEQRFTHAHAVHVGDEVEISRQVHDIYDKRGGAMVFIVVDTRYSVAGREAANSRQTLIVRHDPVEAA